VSYKGFQILDSDTPLIDGLKETHRQLLAMNGESYETMAKTHGIPPGTVRSRLHRARVALERARIKAKNNKLGYVE
jgi:DNA-directed RNA polymerase specialized sigma24 family protein